jgi:hypothetical protein
MSLKHNISEAVFGLLLQVEPTQLGQTDITLTGVVVGDRRQTLPTGLK